MSDMYVNFNPEEWAKNWLQNVFANLDTPGYSIEDQLADHFSGGLPWNEPDSEAVLAILKASPQAKQLALRGENGRAIYMNIFVSDEWYEANGREMGWMEFLNSEFCPEDYPKVN